jgi:hypothetical protein
MSQKAVESFIGRLVTDDQFRQMASNSLSDACAAIGLELTPTEMNFLSRMKISRIADLCRCIDPGLCRAGNSMGE